LQDLENLRSNFCPYFKFFTEDPDNRKWVNLFTFQYTLYLEAKITYKFLKNLICVTTDCWFWNIYKVKSLLEFWCEISKDHPFLGWGAVVALLQLDQSTCMISLCVMAVIMTRQINCLQVALDLILIVSTGYWELRSCCHHSKLMSLTDMKEV
jgi:hypothetical protein